MRSQHDDDFTGEDFTGDEFTDVDPFGDGWADIQAEAARPGGRVKRAIQGQCAGVRRGLSARVATMESRAVTVNNGTRHRSGVAALAGFLALGSMYGLVSANVMAVGFTTANDSYKVYTDRVKGEYAAIYLKNQETSDGANTPVAQIGFKTATLNGMCTVTHQAMFGSIADVSLVIRGGEPVDGTASGTSTSGDLITANELYMSADSLTGNGENIAKMTLGQSADTLMMDTLATNQGLAGNFGLQAEVMQVGDLDANTYGIDLQGSINLPDLDIKVVPGVVGQEACTS